MNTTKKSVYLIYILAIMFLSLSSASYAKSGRSPSFGGATGLIGTPSAHTGWEGTDIGFDVGIHFIGEGGGDSSFSPKAMVQLFGKWEIGGTYDIQGEDDDDLLFHTKFCFYKEGSSALAVGGNFQMINWGPDMSNKYMQLYLAATYSGNFFSMPAETTLVFGKTFGFGDDNAVDNANIDFSMGFDLNLIPSLFKGYVHWINDFSNYSYSVNPKGINSGSRGVFNTGARIVIFRDSRYKLNFDVILADGLDSSRCFAAGAIFGMSI